MVPLYGVPRNGTEKTTTDAIIDKVVNTQIIIAAADSLCRHWNPLD